jgi:hypothetical protein
MVEQYIEAGERGWAIAIEALRLAPLGEYSAANKSWFRGRFQSSASQTLLFLLL